MLIIIDANLFSDMAAGCEACKPVVACVSYGKGFMAYGGRKYKQELHRHRGFLGLLLEWDKMRKTVKLEEEAVDKNEEFLQVSFTHRAYDDHHILAMVIYAGADVVCSVDRGLHRLLDECYSRNGRMTIDGNCTQRCPLRKPGIYQRKEHAGMLK